MMIEDETGLLLQVTVINPLITQLTYERLTTPFPLLEHQLGASATGFLSDGHQPEVDFLHHWAVVWLKLSGKSS